MCFLNKKLKRYHFQTHVYVPGSPNERNCQKLYSHAKLCSGFKFRLQVHCKYKLKFWREHRHTGSMAAAVHGEVLKLQKDCKALEHSVLFFSVKVMSAIIRSATLPVWGFPLRSPQIRPAEEGACLRGAAFGRTARTATPVPSTTHLQPAGPYVLIRLCSGYYSMTNSLGDGMYFYSTNNLPEVGERFSFSLV